MEEKMSESKKSGPVSLECPEYKKVHTKISNLRAMFRPGYRWSSNISEDEKRKRLSKIKFLERERAKMPSKVMGPGYRIKYVRYADDFLIGVNGTEEQCIELKREIGEFL